MFKIGIRSGKFWLNICKMEMDRPALAKLINWLGIINEESYNMITTDWTVLKYETRKTEQRKILKIIVYM